MQYSQDPHPPNLVTHKQEEYFNHRGPSPKGEESEHHIKLPSLVVMHQEDKPSALLALKTSRAYVQESQRATGNRLDS